MAEQVVGHGDVQLFQQVQHRLGIQHDAGEQEALAGKFLLGLLLQSSQKGTHFFRVRLLVHKPGCLDEQVTDLGGDSVQIVGHRVHKVQHDSPVVLVDGKGFLQGHGLAGRGLDLG